VEEIAHHPRITPETWRSFTSAADYWKCCEKTIARLCGRLRRPARLRIISSDSWRSPLSTWRRRGRSRKWCVLLLRNR